MRSLVYRLRTSDTLAGRLARGTYRFLRNFEMPAPRALVRPVALGVLALHRTGQWCLRVFLCEPYLKARCARHGVGIRTGCFFHYISGSGRLVLGDRVRMDGKSSIMFASVLPDLPELSIGDDSYVNHEASFIVARRVTVGRKVLIGPRVTIFDSPGHPLDAARRIAGAAPDPDDIRPVIIGDGAWICSDASIFPGVTIGEGSVVALGAVVTRSVPPHTLVAGSPARFVRSLAPAEPPAPEAAAGP